MPVSQAFQSMTTDIWNWSFPVVDYNARLASDPWETGLSTIKQLVPCVVWILITMIVLHWLGIPKCFETVFICLFQETKCLDKKFLVLVEQSYGSTSCKQFLVIHPYMTRKSRDYVYGKWWSVVLRIKKAISGWSHMRGIIKVTFGQCIKTITKTKHRYVKLTHQLSFRNINLKLDHHTAVKWFIHDPKHRKENRLLSLKHSWWLSWV